MTTYSKSSSSTSIALDSHQEHFNEEEKVEQQVGKVCEVLKPLDSVAKTKQSNVDQGTPGNVVEIIRQGVDSADSNLHTKHSCGGQRKWK